MEEAADDDYNIPRDQGAEAGVVGSIHETPSAKLAGNRFLNGRLSMKSTIAHVQRPGLRPPSYRLQDPQAVVNETGERPEREGSAD